MEQDSNNAVLEMAPPKSSGDRRARRATRKRPRRRREANPAPESADYPRVVVGRLIGLTGDGLPLIDYAGHIGKPMPARSTVALRPADAGRDIALVFEHGDPRRPIITGVLQPPAGSGSAGPFRVDADGTSVVLEAQREMVLRCGEASITLTRAGKVLIKGAYVLSRSSGVNRIKGGSVQIN